MGLEYPRFISRWKGASASFPGRGHIERGLPCQDVSSVLLNNESKVIVVSDGAGSAKHSAHGAAGVVEATIRTLRASAPWNDVKEVHEKILAACRAEIISRASKLACRESELAATLAFAAVAQGVFVAGNLGDGVVVAFRGQHPEILLKPERGEFANETVFFTSRSANKHLRIVTNSLEDRDGFVIMSDGAAESLYRRCNCSLAPALSGILGWFEKETSVRVQDAIQKMVMPKIVDRTMDDCSLAILKLIRLDPKKLNIANIDFLTEFLEAGNKHGLRNRLKVLECISKKGIHDNLEIAEVVGLSASTVRNHRRVLSSLY